jgi:hypothetical protein
MVTCSPRNEQTKSEEFGIMRSSTLLRIEDEEESIYGGADHLRPEAGGSRRVRDRGLPGIGSQPTDLLSVEEEISGDGSHGAQTAEAVRGREPKAQETGC